MFNENLALIAGATFDFDLTWETKDEAGVFSPVIINDCSAEFEIRKSGSNELLVRCSADDGSVKVTAPESGKIDIHIAPEKTLNHLPDNWRDAIWEVVITFPSLDKYSIAWGSASLRRQVVNSTT
jgi:hypothetical protein